MRWFRLLFIVILLSASAMASSDIYEPDNNTSVANVVLVNGSKQFHNFSSDDVDYVKFNATQGSQYVIETFNYSAISITDTVITLYDESSELDSNDDIEANYTYTSRIVFNADENGTYYVKIHEYSGDSGGTYAVSVDEVGRLIPELIEPNSNANISSGLFNFTVSINCVNGRCRNVTAILDPERKDKGKLRRGIVEQFQGKERASVIVVLKEKEKGLRINSFEKKRTFSSFNGYSAELSADEILRLSSDDNVKAIYPNKEVRAHLDVSIPLIDANDVWNMQLDGTNITGKGETVCVIDTGIDYTHADFGSCNTTSNINNGNCEKVIGGYDFVNNDDDPMDDHGHGSHVAGIIASEDDVYRGVAPDAKLVAIKSLNWNGGGSEDDVISGIEWCINHADELNISVISMSLGDDSKHNFYCEDETMKMPIDNATSKNISVIISSGNDYYTDGISGPACIENATAVGAIDDNEDFHYNRGLILDIVAPGRNIEATDYSGSHTSKNGTSMSAPHVSGAVALIRQYFSEKFNRSLNPDAIKNTLKYNGNWDYDSGSQLYFPKLNAYNSVNNKGVIPTAVGAKPFYSLTSNPHNSSCLELIEDGESCNITWIVNATATEGTYEFFVILETEYRHNTSERINLSILNAVKLIEPENGIYTSNNYLNFTCNVTDNSQLSNVSLYGNFNGTWEINQTENLTGTINESSWNIQLSEGSYIWNCKACDTNNECEFAERNFSVTVDTTKPVFSGLNYSSIVELGHSQLVSINITDDNLDIVNISYQGKNHTMESTNDTYYHNFTADSEATINFTIYAWDLASNLNHTNGSFLVNDSTLTPFIYSVSDSGDINQGESQTVDVVAYDKEPLSVKINHNGTNYSLTNVTHTNFSYSWNVSACGTVSYDIFVNNSNHSANSSGEFSTMLCCGNNICESGESCSSCSGDCGECETVTTSSSGGGGGGGSSTISQNEASILVSGNSDEPIKVNVNKEDIPVSEIKIDINKKIEQGKVKVKVLDNYDEKPSENTYKHMEINTEDFDNKDIENVEIRFTVEDAWLEENDVLKKNVVLFHKKENGWQELETKYLMSIKDLNHFLAISPGFSVFAIAEKKAEKQYKIQEKNDTEINQITAKTVKKEAPAEEKFLNERQIKILFFSVTVFYMVSLIYIIISKKQANKL